MVKAKSTLVEKVQTALISIGTTGIVALCGFAFNVHASLARIEQQQLEDERQQLIYESLDKVSRGLSTYEDARFLAGELGLKYKEIT